MMLRKRMPAALLGAALMLLARSLLGGGSSPNFGDPLPGLTADQLAQFTAGQTAFEQQEGVADGLGPVFNDVSCANCHSSPAIGGGSTTLETRFGKLLADGSFDPM